MMRTFIEEKIKDIGVEAFQDPSVVKYYKPSTLHNMTLSDECLDIEAILNLSNMWKENSDAKATKLIKILSQLRCFTHSG